MVVGGGWTWRNWLASVMITSAILRILTQHVIVSFFHEIIDSHCGQSYVALVTKYLQYQALGFCLSNFIDFSIAQ